MNLRFVFVILATVQLVGCNQSVALEAPFNPADNEFALKQGTATLSGQAFMRRNDGLVVYAAGSKVLLVPATPYTREIVSKAETSSNYAQLSNLDMRLNNYTRQSQANGEGRFAFPAIPDGDYLVLTQVSWKAGDWSQGGAIYKFVTVKDGQNIDVILTR